VRIIFRFLDAVYPSNKQQALLLFHQCLEHSTADSVFYLLARQIRYLIVSKSLGKRGLIGLHPFQQQKIFSLSQKYSLNQLIKFHSQLLLADWRQKTSQSDLSFQLDLILASL
jgi:hypothetical protein